MLEVGSSGVGPWCCSFVRHHSPPSFPFPARWLCLFCFHWVHGRWSCLVVCLTPRRPMGVARGTATHRRTKRAGAGTGRLMGCWHTSTNALMRWTGPYLPMHTGSLCYCARYTWGAGVSNY